MQYLRNQVCPLGRFVVVKKPSTKKALAQATHGYQFVADASFIVAALGGSAGFA